MLVMMATTLHAESDAAKPSASTDNDTQCVILRTISGWSRIDDRTLLLRSVGRRYRVQFDAPCYEANWAFGARVDHPGICLRPGDTLIFDIDSSPMAPRSHRRVHQGFEERCIVRSIERLP
jgi:hypothetical protein